MQDDDGFSGMMKTLERMERNMYDPGEYQDSDMANYDQVAASKPKSKQPLISFFLGMPMNMNHTMSQ